MAFTIRSIAGDKATTKADLLRAMGHKHWTTVKTRWDGERDYTATELGNVAEALGTTVPEIWAAAEALTAETLGAVS